MKNVSGLSIIGVKNTSSRTVAESDHYIDVRGIRNCIRALHTTTIRRIDQHQHLTEDGECGEYGQQGGISGLRVLYVT